MRGCGGNRRNELLIDRAMGLLSPVLGVDLFEPDAELASFETAAAAALLALLPGRLQPMPRGLRDRLVALAPRNESGEHRMDAGDSL